MKFQYIGASSVGILANISIFSYLLKSVIGCPVDSNCLPLRAQLANYSSEAYVNAGDHVTITCHTDCRNLTLNGCNVTDHWIAITTDASGTITTYKDINQNSREFIQNNGIPSPSFSRAIDQSGMCDGSQADEQFSVTIDIGDNPNFSTILFSCGLARYGPHGYAPTIVAHDFTAVFKIHLNQPDIQTSTQMAAPTVTSTVSTTVTIANTEDETIAFSDDTAAVHSQADNTLPGSHHTERPVVISLSAILLIVIAIAVISLIVTITVARKYFRNRLHPQEQDTHQGILMNAPYYDHASYPIEAFLQENAAKEGQPA